jgi:hypothetical protein
VSVGLLRIVQPARVVNGNAAAWHRFIAGSGNNVDLLEVSHGVEDLE